MTRIAVISDIHGNSEALKAVLEDIRRKECDCVICLGDVVAKGRHNHECSVLVRNACAVTVRGNCDAYFALDPSTMDNEREKNLIRAYQDTMEAADIAWLQTLPDCYEIRCSGRLVRMFHAGPDSFSNYTSNTLYASAEEKYSMFLPGKLTCSDEKADVVIFGHIHTQLMHKLFSRTLISCGSVGNSLDFIRNPEKDGDVRNTVNAQYLIMDGEESDEYGPLEFRFLQVPYEVEKELADYDDFFEKEAFEYELRQGNYRSHEKIRKILLKDGIDLDEL
jgi:protein phosphatase